MPSCCRSDPAHRQRATSVAGNDLGCRMQRDIAVAAKQVHAIDLRPPVAVGALHGEAGPLVARQGDGLRIKSRHRYCPVFCSVLDIIQEARCERFTMSRIQQSTGQPPVAKSTTLIVFVAFQRDEEGKRRPALEAQQMPSKHAAISRAKLMLRTYTGVIAWKRSAHPDIGEFGDPGCYGSTVTCRIWSSRKPTLNAHSYLRGMAGPC